MVTNSHRSSFAAGTRSLGYPAQREESVARCRARILALTMDFVIYVLLSPVTLGMSAVFLRSFWWAGAIGIALAYLAFAWSSGASPGMQLAGIRVIDARTGYAPAFGRAFLRAALSLPPFVALFFLTDGLLASDPHALRDEPALALWATAVLLAGVLTELWVFFDPQCRGLLDRVTGLVLVESRQDQRKHSPRRERPGTSPL